MTFQTTTGARSTYFRDSVLAASPSRLLTMLYDRLLVDLRHAEAAQEESDWAAANARLIHAQDIITELAGTLKPELWDGGEALLSVYFYTLKLLRAAHIERDIARTREVIDLLEPMRQAWHDASDITAFTAVRTEISAVG